MTNITEDRYRYLIPRSEIKTIRKRFRISLRENRTYLPETYSPAWETWCRLKFALVVEDVYGKGGSEKEFYSIQCGQLAHIGDQLLCIERATNHCFPLYIHPITACCAVAHQIALRRSSGNLKGNELPDDLLILPMDGGTSDLSFEERIKVAKGIFNHWFQELVKSASVEGKISYCTLVSLAVEPFVDVYSKAVLGAMNGLIIYNPAPHGRFADFLLYRKDLLTIDELISDNEQQDSLLYRPRLPGPEGSRVPDSIETEGGPKFPANFTFDALRRLVIQYSRCNKRSEERQRRKETIERLDRYIPRLEKEIGINWKSDLSKQVASTTSWSDWQIQGVNLLCMAYWIREEIKRRPPNTIEAELNALASLLREDPSLLLPKVDENGLADCVNGMDVVESTRLAYMAHYRKFFNYLCEEHFPKMHEIRRFDVGNTHVSREIRLLMQSDFEDILRGMSPDDEVLIAAVLMSYFFGLRIHEVCSIKLGDVCLEGTPTVYVAEGKGGKQRVITSREVPSHILDYLRKYKRDRLHSKTGDCKQAPFLCEAGNTTTEAALRYRWQAAVDRTSLREEDRVAFRSFHALRHACANRWMAIGVDPIDIANRLGHESLETTYREYVHCFHFLQKEIIDRQDEVDPELLLESRAAAGFFGLSQRRFQQLYREGCSKQTMNGSRIILSPEMLLPLLCKYKDTLSDGPATDAAQDREKT